MSTTVNNLRRSPYDRYIGRPGRGHDGLFGNPYTLAQHGDLALDLYRTYLLDRVARDPAFRAACLALRGLRLGCFCDPAPCHGAILAEWIDSQPEVAGG